jgi:predicted transcriptional regulator
LYNDGYNGDYNSYNNDAAYGAAPFSPESIEDNAGAYQSMTDTDIASGNDQDAGDVVILYLKDGTVYATQNFWLMGGKLHFTLGRRAESTIDMNQLDIQRTIDENAKRGVHVPLVPGPTSSGPAA